MIAERKSRRPRRRAFTLIEMVAVCALTSTVMSLVGIALLRMYRVDRQVRDEIRLVGPNTYLGIVYWKKTKTIDFALEFPK